MSVSTSNHVINYNNGRVVGTLSTSEYVHMCFFIILKGFIIEKKRQEENLTTPSTKVQQERHLTYLTTLLPLVTNPS